MLPIEAADADSCDKEYFTQHANSLPAICGDSGCSRVRCDRHAARSALWRQHRSVCRCGATPASVCRSLRCRRERRDRTRHIRARWPRKPTDSVAAFLDTLVADSTSTASQYGLRRFSAGRSPVITVMIVADADAGGAQALAARLEALFADPSSELMRASVVDRPTAALVGHA